MRFTSTFFILLASSFALAAPSATLHTVEKYSGETTGRYIVTFKVDADKSSAKPDSGVTHTWDGAINGFAGHFDDATVEKLRANPDVETITEDGVMHTFVTETNAPWGLSRLSSSSKLSNQDTSALTYSYTYDSSAGAGVDIYIVDTGVFTSHSQFGGRASWGATFGGYADADGNGHGTHCAGTAAGSQFGVAKSANIIAVKVLSDQGSGAVSDIVSGLNFVANRASSTGRPSIVSMSLGGSASTSLDNAVTSVRVPSPLPSHTPTYIHPPNKLTSAGVHVAVAAGNSNTDAGTTSPARATSAVTVGASTIADARASFSNFGSVVDVFAPGQNIISSWIGSTTATNNISGTSMATPHIAGLIAYLIGLQGNVSPAAMSSKIQSLSLKGVISGIPSGTVNDLAHNA
ncbi:hypothetical protein D9756_006339 [Leucocoprinus leucothites]|uniref:Serine protease n=1 Tax=Leucocoprinus leucothites TaxID=201217 RepID=A0A8H5D2Q2_9AGAR|nr:hypothetical protein D9756_006339 [Leucoagaricus leucothites]